MLLCILLCILIGGIICERQDWGLPATYDQGESMSESVFIILLKGDDSDCFLKLICGVGINATDYALQADRITSTFSPFQFSVVRNAILERSLQESARITTDTNDTTVPRRKLESIYVRTPLDSPTRNFAWIKLEPSPIIKFTNARNDKESAFVYKYAKPLTIETLNRYVKMSTRSASNGLGTTNPAIHLLNRALAVGLTGGQDKCDETFDRCNFRADEIIRFSSTHFSSPRMKHRETP